MSNHALNVIQLAALMERTSGRAETAIGLIDGPVAMSHPDLSGEMVREIPGARPGACARASSYACTHGTFVAGILLARRGSPAPAICPGCSLLVRPIFEEMPRDGRMPSATPGELAAAITECIDAGARVVNLSASLAQPSLRGEKELEEALDQATRRGVIVVVAAGNQASIGSSAITRHRWVIPVVACDLRGRPSDDSNLGSSIGRRGLLAPGTRITSLGVEGPPLTFSGTSVAAPFVTGTVALLLSEFRGATAAEVKSAVTATGGRRRTAIIPPLLDAWGAYLGLSRAVPRRSIA